MPIDKPSARGRRGGLQIGSRSRFAARVCTNVGDWKRPSEGTGGGGAGSSEPARVTNILVHGGVDIAPP